MRKLVITRKNELLMVLEYADRFLTDLHLYDEQKDDILSKIVVGRVRDVVPDINAAFVEIAPSVICYLPLQETVTPIFCNAKNNNRICQGDLLLVQVVKEAIKSKAPTLSANLTLTGNYVVFDRTQPGVCGVSKKIKDKKLADSLRELALPYVADDYGCIIRTQAAEVSCEELLEELKHLSAEYHAMLSQGVHHTAFSILKSAPVSYIQDMRAAKLSDEDVIITDQPDVAECITKELSLPVEIYRDDYPLEKCYSLDTVMEELHHKTVWLKCGGNLVIEPCEAMTVIDVNTAKAVDKRNTPEDNYFKINMEAAAEIARQLRLRNISGMIIVDFINMKDEAHHEALIQQLKRLLAEDTVKSTFVDVTALGLVEITREKKRRAVHELFRKG